MGFCREKLKCEKGQSTVEFAIVTFAIICIILALGSLFRELELGVFLEHAISSASHNIVNSINGITDSFCY